MTRKRQHSKSPRPDTRALLKSDSPVLRELKKCAEAQDQLSRAQDLASKWQFHRRETIRSAFRAGASAQEIADAVQLSRAKIYQLIGSARALKA